MELDSIIGSSIPRKDGRSKVTGRAKYGADINLAGQLYAAIHHSSCAHGWIKAIHTEKALAYPGVRAVILGKDFPVCYGQFIADQPILAINKVRYHGEPVAAVVADTDRIAHEAARLIEVEYDPLPVVDTIEDALTGTSLVHENWDDYIIYGLTHPQKETNIIDRFQLIHGDVEKGFAEADVIVENEFYCSMLQHAVIETHVALADATPDKLVIYSPAQSPFSVRGSIAKLLGYRMDQVQIIITEIGGGFGCKAEPKLEPIVAMLSKKVGRPVKLVYDRNEEFEATLTRAPAKFYLKTGATKEGKLTAQTIKVYWDTGAYGTFGPRVNYNAGYASNGPYMIPNCHTDGYCLVTNHSLGTAYRGFGITEVCCAHETQMDELAHRLNMDPVEFRLKNVLRDGMTNVTGEVMVSSGVAECVEKAAENIDWGKTPEHWVTPDGKLHGKGIACFIKLSGTPSTTSCTVRMNEDGSINIMSASTEMGQGVRTVLPQFVTSVLGVDIEKITVSQIDTAITPYDKTTTSSRSTFHSGNAVLEASQEIARQLRILVGKKWNVPAEDVLLADGVFTCKTNSEKRLHINDIGKSGVLKEERPVIAVGRFGTKDIFDPPDELTHQTSRTTIMWMMGCQAAEVEVDPKTGQVRIVRIGAAHDVGHAINPLGCLQQIEGGMVMGAGHALTEEMIYQDGILKNGNMVDYKVPTSMDADFEYKISLVETAHPEGPYGAKGIGEPGVAPTAPAIANAISAACQHRFHAIPIKPEDILFREEG